MTIFLSVLSSLLLLFTIMSLIKNDYWTFRVFDYPRLQKFVVSAVCLALLAFYYEPDCWVYTTFIPLIAANLIYLGWLIWPFTVFAKKQVLRIKDRRPDDQVCVMISNVYQDNQNHKGCLAVVRRANPDVLLLLETDKAWDEGTKELSEAYKYSVKVPLENTYGMLLYSKLELKESEVKYMVEEGIPSIHTKIVLKGGRQVQLYAVHPTPPVPNENPRSTERDKELLLVADLAKVSKLPVIVVGDLNDVAWSYTTELFLKMSGLLDPRRGRGFYNSFHAHYPFLRFPLDHAFISTDFKLVGMKRLSNFKSDHFPIYIHLQYEQVAKHQQESLEVDADDVELAEEKKAKV
ncbi:endonuclease [Flavobacterium sp. Sd200]|uniref:endonuclease/exonuclease/phosphatase family protein n=1 Tax=Flavobacterium sp. Sd200 TaxID=2692211 RepID=UPI00136CB945|nr:endonuclease/exonuclease/phosphatase family protein [Flavobacterium sp. Sd200]MXN89660.1 endonuclease [Flavobacterium sp. Sd200]